jgi:hypothetical protein
LESRIEYLEDAIEKMVEAIIGISELAEIPWDIVEEVSHFAAEYGLPNGVSEYEEAEEDDERTNVKSLHAQPGEDPRASADGCKRETCWHWMQCGDSACDRCDLSKDLEDGKDANNLHATVASNGIKVVIPPGATLTEEGKAQLEKCRANVEAHMAYKVENADTFFSECGCDTCKEEYARLTNSPKGIAIPDPEEGCLSDKYLYPEHNCPSEDFHWDAEVGAERCTNCGWCGPQPACKPEFLMPNNTTCENCIKLYNCKLAVLPGRPELSNSPEKVAAHEDDDVIDRCPCCGTQLIEAGRDGVKCPRPGCNYWFCY